MGQQETGQQHSTAQEHRQYSSQNEFLYTHPAGDEPPGSGNWTTYLVLWNSAQE